VIEGLLLTAFVGAIVLLMHSISRSLSKGEKRTLGLFSYREDGNVDTSDSVKKG